MHGVKLGPIRANLGSTSASRELRGHSFGTHECKRSGDHGSGDQVRKLISLLKDEFMPDGDVNLQVERIQFESGQQVVDWVREANRNLTEDDVEQ